MSIFLWPCFAYGKKGFTHRMLQPLQLKEVSIRYAEEIAELRDFLAKAGSPVGTVESLGGVAARLQRDRAFRRDLTSHVWVVIHRCDRQISYSDLLGLLAIAAAGTHFAAAAEEDDAHDLLRFLMEAWRSLDAVSEQRSGTPERWAAGPATDPSAPHPSTTHLSKDPLPSVSDDGGGVFDRPVPSSNTEIPSVEAAEAPQDLRGERRRLLWAAAACVLAASSVGVWLHRRPVADGSNPPAPIFSTATGTVAVGSSAKKGESSSSLRGGAATTTADVHASAVPRSAHDLPRDLPFGRTTRLSRETPETAASISAHPPTMPPRAATATTHGTVSTQTVATVQTPAWKVRPAASAAASPLAPATATTGSSAAVGISSATLSRRLGSPTLPPDSSAQRAVNDAEKPQYPRLLRRKPLAPPVAGDEAKLVVDGRLADGSAAAGTSRNGAANATRGGIVRLTSLGTMAANVLYSPVPAYPVAASAENVQGEVKVRADVDRDGNVASARVISGPPLLRDAALDAVQRWRYRPYVSYGKPAPMTAIAVVDFQLP